MTASFAALESLRAIPGDPRRHLEAPDDVQAEARPTPTLLCSEEGSNALRAGGGLRSVAAEIPCAASTLSVRIKQAEAAEEAAASERAASGEQELEAAGRADYVRELKRIALGHDPTASARDRLSAIKELLKLEPATSEQAAVGAVFHVYPGHRIVADEEKVAREAEREDLSEP